MTTRGEPLYTTLDRLRVLRKIMLSRPGQLRYLIRWMRSLRVDYLVDHEMPWITFSAIDFIKEKVKRDHKVFEYGSGGSTLFWARQVALCVSIEHDARWFSKISVIVRSAPNVDYRLVCPQPVEGQNKDVADPDLYLSDDPPWQGYSFIDYVAQIDRFPDGYFDWVMIDGRARPSCIRHAVSKVRPGCFLILDNADRSYYTSKARVYLESFTCTRFTGMAPCVCHEFSTDIYQKSL